MVYLSIAARASGILPEQDAPGLNISPWAKITAAADAAASTSPGTSTSPPSSRRHHGLGGLYIVMNSSSGVGGVWIHNCISGYGWLSVALVIFATWHPSRAVYCALAFGALSVMRFYFPVSFIAPAVYEILPYVANLVLIR
jgi:simple sugar transport system permease protein